MANISIFQDAMIKVQHVPKIHVPNFRNFHVTTAQKHAAFAALAFQVPKYGKYFFSGNQLSIICHHTMKRLYLQV